MLFINIMYRWLLRLERNCWNRSIVLLRRCLKTGSRFWVSTPALWLSILAATLASQANSEQRTHAPVQKNLSGADTGRTSPHSFKTAVDAAEKLVVSRPSQAGNVEGQTANSDEFIWTIFLNSVGKEITTKGEKAQFETWASDNTDTFVLSPKWPLPDAPSFKIQCKDLNLKGSPAGFRFPADGCVIEDIKRNREQFDYIISNGLNTASGLAASFSKDSPVHLPISSISIKAEWVTFDTLRKWVPGWASATDIRIMNYYYTALVNDSNYALVALHIASKQNENWVWGTFEHVYNPGRCDYTGCFDSFGSLTPVQLPNTTTLNSSYTKGCQPSDKLRSLFSTSNARSIWLNNYCLKSTQVDFVDSDSIPSVLGNTVVEGIVADNPIVSSSCITCHSYAAYGADGRPTTATNAMTIFSPIGNTDQNILNGTKGFDFMWGFKNAP